MADNKPYKEGQGVSAGKLNRMHQAAIRDSQPPNSMRLPYGTFGRAGKGGIAIKFAVLDEAMTTDGGKIGEAEATVWAGDPLAATDPVETITVHNWLLGASETLASGTRIVVIKLHGKWYVIQASCG